VSRRDVTLAERNDQRVSVTEGLKPGDRVVLAGARSLGEGQRVCLSDKPQ
jgi:multidrug efflux pump subunit AcrA (membrane-fusion protein)